MLDLDQEMDKLAQLVALRANRKMGRKPNLHAVGSERAREPQDEATEEPPSRLPDWTTFQAVDVSERALKMHKIMVIANTYSWQIAVTHFLMTKGVPYLSDLTGPQLDDLLDRMHGYVDAAETGACLEDALPMN